MARLLIVHHTPSPTLQSMLESARGGAQAPEITGVEVRHVPALGATVRDVLAADAYLLGTPANLGYISGALKHFFDQIYYPCLDATRARPFGAYLHGDSDAAGALRAIETITTGLGWQQVAEPVVLTGKPDSAGLQRCAELGATLAATVMPD